MRFVALLMIVALTSLAAYTYGTRALGLSRHHVGAAWGSVLDAVGLGCAFLALNFALAFAMVLVARAAGARFLSLHEVNDVSLAVFSLLQGLTLQLWRRESGLDAR